ncbi:hypothetical protein GXW74_15680 [Roseomonas eburnea]|uniref:Uncharacterized protein n=1 Tax=Neoroseomonas eburnea TaxID=1346889 RepID=A0A9X9XDZ9_9PROT|nr:hypothetical protein [Neoroseomonas eburnea]MBR0681935.1 hypothetical protein [Neoroseomonas eburnea]
MTPPPPAELDTLTRAIGADALLRLIEAHAGTRVYVPIEPNQGSPLARLIGLDAARALAKIRPGAALKVPLAREWRVRLYRSRGESYSTIARRLGITESTVGKLLAQAGQTRAQLDLFA